MPICERAKRKSLTGEVRLRLSVAVRVTRDQRHFADATRLLLALFENYALDAGINVERWWPQEADTKADLVVFGTKNCRKIVLAIRTGYQIECVWTPAA